MGAHSTEQYCVGGPAASWLYGNAEPTPIGIEQNNRRRTRLFEEMRKVLMTSIGILAAKKVLYACHFLSWQLLGFINMNDLSWNPTVMEGPPFLLLPWVL